MLVGSFWQSFRNMKHYHVFTRTQAKEYLLDKENTSYDDLLDALRLGRKAVLSNRIKLIYYLVNPTFVFYVIILRRTTLLTRMVISTVMSMSAADLGNNLKPGGL